MKDRKRRSSHTRDDAFDAPVFYGLLALLVWAPLPLGSNRLWSIGLLLLAVLALLVSAAWLWRAKVDLAARRVSHFAVPLTLLAGMVLLAWLQTLPLPAALVQAISPAAARAQPDLTSMTLSLDVFQSRVMAALSFVYFGAFLLTVLTVRSNHRADLMARVLVGSAVAQAVLGAVLFSIKANYQIFFVELAHDRMLGTYVYHNSAAGYLCMCLAVGVGLMLARLGQPGPAAQGWKQRLAQGIEFMLSPKMRLRMLLIIIVIALVLTRSRMGNAAFFASLIVVGLLAVAVARKSAPHTIALIVSLIIIDVVVVGSWVGVEQVVKRIQDTELTEADGGEAESVEARTEAGRTALALVQDFPLVGSGGGSFYNVFLSYRTPQYGYAYIDHTHNDYVEIASDFGLVGLGLLAALVVSTLVVTVRVLARRRSPLPWGLAFGVTLAVVTLAIHSTVDFNLQIPANALTMVMVLALGWVTRVLPHRQSRVARAGTVTVSDDNAPAAELLA